MKPTDILVTDLRPGDETPWYTILDVEPTLEGVKLHVQHPDGGDSYRTFDPDQIMTVVSRGEKNA